MIGAREEVDTGNPVAAVGMGAIAIFGV